MLAYQFPYSEEAGNFLKRTGKTIFRTRNFPKEKKRTGKLFSIAK
jgi:hypothetical protein